MVAMADAGSFCMSWHIVTDSAVAEQGLVGLALPHYAVRHALCGSSCLTGLMIALTCRKALGLRPVESFTDITPDAAISKTLKQLYGTPNNIGKCTQSVPPWHHAMMGYATSRATVCMCRFLWPEPFHWELCYASRKVSGSSLCLVPPA